MVWARVSPLRAPCETGIYDDWNTYGTDGSGAADADDDALNFLSSNDYPILEYLDLPEAAHLGAQPPSASDFGTAMVANKIYCNGLAIEPFQIPGGNGFLSYA